MRAEDNKFPYFTLQVTTAPAVLPDAGTIQVWSDSGESGAPKWKDAAGVIGMFSGTDGVDGAPSRFLIEDPVTGYPPRPAPTGDPVVFVGATNPGPTPGLGLMEPGDLWINNSDTTPAPTTYTAAEVDALIAGISGMDAEGVRDTIAAALVAGANVTITVDDAGDTITIAATGGGGASGAHHVRAYRTTGQTFAASTVTTVTWEATTYDPEDLWVAGSPSRITIEQDGRYRVHAQLSYNSTSGQIQARLNKNGTLHSVKGGTATATSADIDITDEIDCVAGDYIEVSAYATQTGTRTLLGSSSGTYLTVSKIN